MNAGLMVPSNNTTMEPELLAWLPAGSTCRTIKIPRGAGLLTRETVPAYVASALELGRQFSEMDLDVIAYGCTAAGFIMGPEADAELARKLAAASGKRVVTTARSMVEVLRECGARDIAVVTPYAEEVNRQLTAFLAASGIRVRRLDTFGVTGTEALGRIQAPEVAALARKTMAADCDALFIACSQLPTHSILEGLRKEFGRPVWSSIHATAWQARRALAPN